MLRLSYGDRYPAPCVLLLGGFDGLHTGHLTLLAEAKRTGLPVGITSIAGGKGAELFTQEEREEIFLRFGFAFSYAVPFTPALKETSAERFLRTVFGGINVKAAVCGEDFRFGRNALGTPALLASLAPCPVRVMPLVREKGEKIAASSVKKLLSEGDMRGANRLLASDYFISGTVEHGRGVGRTYGFPTVNLSCPAEKFLMREGVYGGYAETEAGQFPAVVNAGARPTFGVPEKKVEAYLDGFSGDLYGTAVRLYPTEFFRPIEKFSDVAALKTQLCRDIKRIRGDL